VRKSWAIALLTLLALFAVYWFVYGSPQDLQPGSIRVIRWQDIPAIDADGHLQVPEPDKLLAVVEIHTSENLAAFSTSHFRSGLYVHWFLCATNTTISEGFNLVYGTTGRVSFGEPRMPSKIGYYHVYLALNSSDIPSFSKYNLLETPQDVCVVLVPDTEFGFGHTTNVVRLTKSELLNAISSRAGLKP
jgi:hypothetical protein